MPCIHYWNVLFHLLPVLHENTKKCCDFFLSVDLKVNCHLWAHFVGSFMDIFYLHSSLNATFCSYKVNCTYFKVVIFTCYFLQMVLNELLAIKWLQLMLFKKEKFFKTSKSVKILYPFKKNQKKASPDLM